MPIALLRIGKDGEEIYNIQIGYTGLFIKPVSHQHPCCTSDSEVGNIA